MGLSKSGIDYLTHVWNPVVGCNRECVGCWLPGLLKRIGRSRPCELCERNVPHVHTERLEMAGGKPKRIGLGFFTDLWAYADAHWPRANQFGAFPQHEMEQELVRRVRKWPQHRFITPTQCPENIPADLESPDNWWLLVTVRDQDEADERIPTALASPFKHVGASYEPALGPVEFREQWFHHQLLDEDGVRWEDGAPDRAGCWQKVKPLAWVVAGGMSGRLAVPAHPDWFRRVRDQCQAAGVPFYFKQWGAWAPASHVVVPRVTYALCEHGKFAEFHREAMMAACGTCTRWEGFTRLGKRKAGYELDGREWRELPEALLLPGEPNG